MHDKYQNNIPLTDEEFNKTYYELNKLYFGDNMVSDELISHEWKRIPHFYTSFYVYKYATGISSAISIADNILNKGETFVNRYIEMLKQGCSKKSIDLLKMEDVYLECEHVYKQAINFYEGKIKELEQLI